MAGGIGEVGSSLAEQLISFRPSPCTFVGLYVQVAYEVLRRLAETRGDFEQAAEMEDFQSRKPTLARFHPNLALATITATCPPSSSWTIALHVTK